MFGRKLLVSLALRERLGRLNETAAAVGIFVEIHVPSLGLFRRPLPARPEHRHWVIKDSAGPSMTYVKRRNSREFRHPLADAKNGHPLRVIWGGWSGAKRGYDPVSR